MANRLSGCGAEYTHCSCSLQRVEDFNLWGISYPLNKCPENQKVIIPFSHNPGMSSKPTEEERKSSITQSQLSSSQLSVRNFEDELRGSPHLSTPLVPQDARKTSVNVSHFYANNRELHRPTSDIETLLCSFSALHTIPPSQNTHDALLYTPVSFSYTDPEEILARSDVPPAVPLQSRYDPRRGPRPSAMSLQSTEEALVPNGMSSSSISLQSEVRSSSSVSSDETEHLPLVKTGLYKTELCRSWEETGNCRYSTKCQLSCTLDFNNFQQTDDYPVHPGGRASGNTGPKLLELIKRQKSINLSQFAHGNEDLRPVPRHPKYKTEMCRSYTETGLCSYGKRCRFIHRSNSMSSSCSQAPIRSADPQKHRSRRLSIFQQLCLGGEQHSRQS